MKPVVPLKLTSRSLSLLLETFPLPLSTFTAMGLDFAHLTPLFISPQVQRLHEARGIIWFPHNA